MVAPHARRAAEHADIVAITANLRAGAVGEDAIADSMPEAYDRKIARVKEVPAIALIRWRSTRLR